MNALGRARGARLGEGLRVGAREIIRVDHIPCGHSQGRVAHTPLPQLVRVSTHSTDTNFALVLGLPQDMPPQPRSSDLFGMTP